MKIKLSRSQWEQIGKTAGWMKTAQILPFESEEILRELTELMDQEDEIRRYSGDVAEMEEATAEDLDAGFGRGMANSDFKSTLVNPTLFTRPSKRAAETGEVDLMFRGNNSPKSVNAGRERIVYLGTMTGFEAHGMMDMAVKTLGGRGLTKERR